MASAAALHASRPVARGSWQGHCPESVGSGAAERTSLYPHQSAWPSPFAPFCTTSATSINQQAQPCHGVCGT
eukprot:1159294-Pelagomonas_calceolata.AAC.2